MLCQRGALLCVAPPRAPDALPKAVPPDANSLSWKPRVTNASRWRVLLPAPIVRSGAAWAGETGNVTVANKIPNPIDKHVGRRVRMRRMMLGMSQEKLGDALDLTFQQVQKYEKGTNRISASR